MLTKQRLKISHRKLTEDNNEKADNLDTDSTYGDNFYRPAVHTDILYEKNSAGAL